MAHWHLDLQQYFSMHEVSDTLSHHPIPCPPSSAESDYESSVKYNNTTAWHFHQYWDNTLWSTKSTDYKFSNLLSTMVVTRSVPLSGFKVSPRSVYHHWLSTVQHEILVWHLLHLNFSVNFSFDLWPSNIITTYLWHTSSESHKNRF